MLCIRIYILPTLFAINNNTLKILYVEINLKNNKYLVYCPYHPQKIRICNPIVALSKFVNLDFKSYDKILTVEYFSRMMYESHMQSFCHMSLKV